MQRGEVHTVGSNFLVVPVPPTRGDFFVLEEEDGISKLSCQTSAAFKDLTMGSAGRASGGLSTLIWNKSKELKRYQSQGEQKLFGVNKFFQIGWPLPSINCRKWKGSWRGY